MDIMNLAKESTIQIYKKILNLNIQRSIIGTKLILTKEIRNVSYLIPNELIKKIYLDVFVFTDKKYYYITLENRLIVSTGIIGEIGVMETIYRDLEELYLVHNATISMALEEENKFDELINVDSIDELIIQLRHKKNL